MHAVPDPNTERRSPQMVAPARDAVLYAREGADVAVAYLNEHEDAEETKQAVEREGRRCFLMSGDVADPHFCREAVGRTIQEFGKLDVLVNNAAFQEHVDRFEDL